MAKGNGRRTLFKAGALGTALAGAFVVGRRGGLKVPTLAKLFRPRGQTALEKETRSPFPTFFRETRQARSERARRAALKAQAAKVPLLGGEGILGSLLDLFG